MKVGMHTTASENPWLRTCKVRIILTHEPDRGARSYYIESLTPLQDPVQKNQLG